MASSNREASIPNALLQPLGLFIGTWKTQGTHPLIPDTTLHGQTSFEWIEGGAFMLMRSEIDEPGIPSAIGLFGSDDAAGEIFMLYFDERGVSRKFDVSVDGRVWKWWRNAPGFSQRFTMTFADDGRAFVGK